MPQQKQSRPKPIHTADELGLNVLGGESDLFRWFLAAFLLGKPIQSTVAMNTWQLFVDAKMDTPWAINEASRRTLSQLLHEGKYTRYQEVMTTALQRCMQQLLAMYDGSLLLLIESSDNEDECAKRLQELYGVGPKTAQIFMRETDELFARRIE